LGGLWKDVEAARRNAYICEDTKLVYVSHAFRTVTTYRLCYTGLFEVRVDLLTDVVASVYSPNSQYIAFL
jgi:hypothetical protein